jgi:hypothetical protein
VLSAGDWKLHEWDEDPKEDEEFPPYDPKHALDWVKAAWGDPNLVRNVRRMVARSTHTDVFRLPDHAIRKLAAREIEYGRFRILARYIPTPAGIVSEGSEISTPLLPPRRSPSSSPSAPADEQTFPPDADAVAIAAVLQDAANSGVPFCEECAKAAAAQKQQQSQGQQPQDEDEEVQQEKY